MVIGPASKWVQALGCRCLGARIAPHLGKGVHRNSERRAEANDGAECGGGQPTSLDLAQRLRRYAGSGSDVVEGARSACGPQGRPEAAPCGDLVGGEGGADHVTTIAPVFKYR